MSGDAQPSSNQRATEARPPPSPPLVNEKAAIGALVSFIIISIHSTNM